MALSAKSKASQKPLRYVCFLFLVIATFVTFLLLSRKHPAPNPKSPSLSSVPSLKEQSDTAVFAAYGRSETCQACHESEYQLWRTSHHALAERSVNPALDAPAFSAQAKIAHGSQMSEVSTNQGLFQIVTAGLDGSIKPFTPERVIGVEPLRQFMIPSSGGRFQVTELAYDPNHTNWFDVYGQEDRRPGEWGHWTGRGMTWNSMCASCHNTRLRKHYDSSTDSYHTVMAERAVGCEACHGPLASHKAWQQQHPNKKGDPTVKALSRDQMFETCGSCHARRAQLTGDFKPGESFFDHYILSVPDESETFYPDGQIH